MDEEITIIDAKTRNEKIKNFFINNKKIIFSVILILVVILIGYFSFQNYSQKQKLFISNKFNSAVIDYDNGNLSRIVNEMKEVINNKDSTYSPLALYFLIDNNLIENRDEINELFNVIIDETSLEFEIKNLIIYKKSLYNADFVDENELLETLKPLINSESVWKSHALYLIAEYFYSKKEMKKSKEFYNQLLITKNANQDLIKEAQKRLNRDLSD